MVANGPASRSRGTRDYAELRRRDEKMNIALNCPSWQGCRSEVTRMPQNRYAAVHMVRRRQTTHSDLLVMLLRFSNILKPILALAPALCNLRWLQNDDNEALSSAIYEDNAELPVPSE